MRGVMLLNGLPYDGEICADDAYVVCCDGAYLWAHGKVRIDENVGDFDSLDFVPEPPPSEIYPSEKDFTDGEIALKKLFDAGADSIEIYGGGGRREDHFLGNLHLLFAAYEKCGSAKMLLEGAEIFVGSGKIILNGIKGKTFSVLPFGGTLHIKNSAGFKYAYPDEITYGQCRGISNVAVSDEGFLQTGEGEKALIIVNKGEV